MRSRHQLFPCVDTVEFCSFWKTIGKNLITTLSVFRRCSQRSDCKWKFIISFSASVISLHRRREFRHCNHRCSTRICHRYRYIKACAPVGHLLIQPIYGKLISFTSGKLFYIIFSKDQRSSDPKVSVLLHILLIQIFRSIPDDIRSFSDLPGRIIVLHSRRFRIAQKISISILIGCRSRHQVMLLIDNTGMCQNSVFCHLRVRMNNVFRRKKSIDGSLKCSVSFRIPVRRIFLVFSSKKIPVFFCDMDPSLSPVVIHMPGIFAIFCSIAMRIFFRIPAIQMPDPIHLCVC